MGPAGVGIILDQAGDRSPDKWVSIVKRDMLTLGAGVVRPGNPIRMSDLPVGVSEIGRASCRERVSPYV